MKSVCKLWTKESSNPVPALKSCSQLNTSRIFATPVKFFSPKCSHAEPTVPLSLSLNSPRDASPFLGLLCMKFPFLNLRHDPSPPLLRTLHPQMNNTTGVCFKHASNASRHPRCARASRIETTLHEKKCPLFQLQRDCIAVQYGRTSRGATSSSARRRSREKRRQSHQRCARVRYDPLTSSGASGLLPASIGPRRKEAPLALFFEGPPVAQTGEAEVRHCLHLRTTAPPPAPDEPTGPSHWTLFSRFRGRRPNNCFAT